MLKLIEGSVSSFFPKEMDAMFRNRAEIFADRLGWVTAAGGHERDVFDNANPLYLVSFDPHSERYLGSLRLLPTTGPNMLRDVFPFLLGEGEVIESATIWEASRICAVPRMDQPERAGVNFAIAELLVGIGEVALRAGLTQIVSVLSERFFRVLRVAGCNPQIIGKPQRMGRVALFDTGEDLLRELRERLGI